MQQGVRMQQFATTHQYDVAAEARAAAAAKREQEAYEQAEEDRKQAADIISRLYPTGGTPQQAAPPPPSPFPSPVTAPKGVPIVAQGNEPTVVDRIAGNPPIPGGGGPESLMPVAMPQPQAPQAQATQGTLSREQLAQMVANPVTRPMALDYLKKLEEGSKPIPVKEGEGFLVRDPNAPSGYRMIEPGGGLGSKEEREAQGYYKAGINLGMMPEQAKAYAANKGKSPEPSGKAQATLLANEAAIPQAKDVIENIDTLAALSPDATSGTLGHLETALTGGLGSYTPEAVKKTQQMQQLATMNVLQQVRALFPGRVLAAEFKTLQTLEHPELFSDEVRQQSYTRLKKMAQDRLDEMQRENEGIRTGKIFQPGFGSPEGSLRSTTAPTPTPAPAAPANAVEAEMRRRGLLK
jgi:hypothetical protein